VAESNVPSTQTGFSVKESLAQNELIHHCVEGRTNGAYGSRRGKKLGETGEKGRERLCSLGQMICQK